MATDANPSLSAFFSGLPQVLERPTASRCSGNSMTCPGMGRCGTADDAALACDGRRGVKDRDHAVGQADREVSARGSEGNGAGVSDLTEVEIPALVGVGGGLP